MEIRKLEYKYAQKYIKEGDVLLFRAKQWGFLFPTVSFFIARATEGVHTHAGMATWTHEKLECVEFKEWVGGRIVSLDRYVEVFDGDIDVFRVKSPQVLLTPYILDNKLIIQQKQVVYDGIKATSHIRNLTGLPYGWSRVWKMVKYYFLGMRLFIPPNIDDKYVNGSGKSVYVCSTAVVEAIRKCFVDPVPFRPDGLVAPSHLASSAVLQYLFTIEKDKNGKQEQDQA